ncbi:hypothetical protein ACFY2R_29945 [Micromonospora olivasterospora]|uniref:hypothetical protein n=1 Tax=Micromonospora olivasterospora TaxID=1880 RepID=UPI0031E29670
MASEQAAWKPIVSSLARPEWSVALTANDAVEQVERQWRRLVHERGLASGDGTLLISLTRQDDDGGWVVVRLPDGPLVLDALGPNPGEPEFVAMSLVGDVVCGVTAEEYELWVVCARLD